MVSLIAFSQVHRITLMGGIGPGVAVYKQPDDDRARMSAFAGVYYNFSNRVVAGMEATTAGRFSVFGIRSGFEYEESTNTRVLNPYNPRASTFLTKGIYQWDVDGLKPFAALGIGVNTYRYDRPVNTVESVSRSNFAIQPEAGFSLGSFQLSLKYLFGGRTASFEGLDEDQNPVRLESIRMNAWYLTAAFLLRPWKSREVK